MTDKGPLVKSSQASKAQSDPTPMTPDGQGGQQKAPLVPLHQEGSRSPSKGGTSTPFSYATAVANRTKAPFTGSVECDQYRVLAAKARESPRILSIKLQRPPASNQEAEKPLSQLDWGELLFNSCGINPGDIRGVDFAAGGALNCEVKLTDNADITSYVGISGSYKNYSYNTLGPAEAEVLVTFKGVPLEVPDIEITWLLKSYGYKPSPEGVRHSPASVTSLDKEVSCKALESTTRSIRATPPTGRRLRGFYFWAGLQEADKPRKVSVDHKGRGPRQCPHCLKTAFETFPCPFNAKGSACKRHGATRTSLAQYNKILREQDGYQTLRQLMFSSPALDDQEPEQESDLPPAQLEMEGEVEVEEEEASSPRHPEELSSLLLHARSWAEEPSSLVSLQVEEPLEKQVATLTKQLSDAKDAATVEQREAARARQKLAQVELESKESKRALSLTRRRFVTETKALLSQGEQTWSSNTERLIDQLSNTVKLSDFFINAAGKLEVKEGHHPFADLNRDIQSMPSPRREKARSRADEIIQGVMRKTKTRVLQQEGSSSRPASRSREPDSEEEQSSSKAQKPSPTSPPHREVEVEMGAGNKEEQSSSTARKPSPTSSPHREEEVEKRTGNKEEQSSSKAQNPSPTSPPHLEVEEEDGKGKEGWPALPSPAKGGLQVPTKAPGGQHATSPPKDTKGPKGPGAQPQPSMGANSPPKDSSASKSQGHVAPTAEGPKSGLQKPGVSGKGPNAPGRNNKPSEDEGPLKGTPQKGSNPAGSNKATKDTSKPSGPHLKPPQLRPLGPLAKADFKVANKAKQ